MVAWHAFTSCLGFYDIVLTYVNITDCNCIGVEISQEATIVATILNVEEHRRSLLGDDVCSIDHSTQF